MPNRDIGQWPKPKQRETCIWRRDGNLLAPMCGAAVPGRFSHVCSNHGIVWSYATKPLKDALKSAASDAAHAAVRAAEAECR